MARNRYMFFAKTARKEGYHYIAKIFEETAENEMYHALEEYRLLYGEKTTLDNLKEAIKGEAYESETMYPEFATIAKEEGLPVIAAIFNAIAVAEKQHEKRYLELAANIEAGKVFAKDGSEKWRCLNCGYVHEGSEALKMCPACAHPQSYFELLGENW